MDHKERMKLHLELEIVRLRYHEFYGQFRDKGGCLPATHSIIEGLKESRNRWEEIAFRLYGDIAGTSTVAVGVMAIMADPYRALELQELQAALTNKMKVFTDE